GRAAGLYGWVRNPDPRTTDRAARKIHQHSFREQSCVGPAWSIVTRSAPRTDGPNWPAFLATGTAARHTPGGAAVDRRQCPDRSGQISLLSPDHADSKFGISKFGAHRTVHRAGRILDLWFDSRSAHFHRWETPVQRSP